MEVTVPDYYILGSHIKKANTEWFIFIMKNNLFAFKMDLEHSFTLTLRLMDAGACRGAQSSAAICSNKKRPIWWVRVQEKQRGIC